MKRKILVLFMAVALLCPGGIYGVDDNLAATNLISVDFQGTTLYTVLNVLSMKTGMKLISDTNLYNRKIMLSLQDVTPDEALNALLDTYNLYYVKQGDSNIYVIKSKEDGHHITVSRIIFCNYAKATELEKVLSTKLSEGGKIVSDDRTNSLIITDLADSLDKMEGLVRALDIPTQQVLLEAKVIDINLTNGLGLGNYFGAMRTNSNPNLNYYTRGTNFTKKEEVLDPIKLTNAFGAIGVQLVEGDWLFTSRFEAGITERNSKILSNPKLLVLNNMEATIDIVEEIPYLESSTTSSSTGDISGTTSFKQVGIKLKVRPQINRDGSIILKIAPEQSYRTGETMGTDNIPVIKTSKSETTLMLKSGETAAIGGLIREDEDETINKIPLLGDIPILGYLFKSKSKNKARYELTIFITAKIIN